MSVKYLNKALTNNKKLLAWVDEWASICEPEGVYWCDGSAEEYDRLANEMVESGLATRLSEKKRPHSLLFRSDVSDVARVEARTYIASEKQEDAGPTNNWIDPKELKKTMLDLYKGCMHGRIMYVIPYSMGPLGSKIAKIGIELTDSAYVKSILRIFPKPEKFGLTVPVTAETRCSVKNVWLCGLLPFRLVMKAGWLSTC